MVWAPPLQYFDAYVGKRFFRTFYVDCIDGGYNFQVHLLIPVWGRDNIGNTCVGTLIPMWGH